MFDDGDLPKWFKDDEDKHQYKIEPITKDEFQAEKQKLLAINAKVPKKVFKIQYLPGYGVQNQKVEENPKENEKGSTKGLSHFRARWS